MKSDVCTISASGRSYLIENPGGRVRVVIQPRATDAPAPAPVPLKPAERIAPAPVR